MVLARALSPLCVVLLLGIAGCSGGARPEGTPAPASSPAPTPTPAPAPTPAPTPAPAPTPTACVDCCSSAADCRWGEIRTEITQRTDCMCLLGCPSIPMNKATLERRQHQYATLCSPGQDGQGQPCPIDDCAAPPAIACVDGHCAVAPAPTPGPSVGQGRS